MTKNPGDSDSKILFTYAALSSSCCVNISITRVIALSNKMIADIIFMRISHTISSLKLVLFLSAAKVDYRTFSCCNRSYHVIYQKKSNLKESIIYHNIDVNPVRFFIVALPKPSK